MLGKANKEVMRRRCDAGVAWVSAYLGIGSGLLEHTYSIQQNANNVCL